MIFGGILLVMGHFGMALEGAPAQQTLVYHGQTYEFVKTDDKTAKLKIGDTLYAVVAAYEPNLTIQGLPAGAPVPAAASVPVPT